MSGVDHKQALPPGFRLGTYHVVRVLGVGGFGVTYLCEHTGLAVQVAVKEYLPNEIAVRDGTEVHPKSAGDREGFEWGLSRFLEEARTLARFEHPNVVRVRDCFEANHTAYIVMDYEDGEPLDALLQRHGTLTEAQLKRVLLPVADGLRQVHAAGFLHRDIKPANFFVRRSDESPVLLDFGSARQALGRRSRSVTAIASAGYSPPEQYESEGEQGPWTDIYALSALCYRAITGEAPMEATRRQSQLLRGRTDPLRRLAESSGRGYSAALLEAVDWGLRLIEKERPPDLNEWLVRIGDVSAADGHGASAPAVSTGDRRTLNRGRSPPRRGTPTIGTRLLSAMRGGIRLSAPKGWRLLGPTEYLRMLFRLFLKLLRWSWRFLGRSWRFLRRSVTGGFGLGKTFWFFGVVGTVVVAAGVGSLLSDAWRVRRALDEALVLAPIAPSAAAVQAVAWDFDLLVKHQFYERTGNRAWSFEEEYIVWRNSKGYDLVAAWRDLSGGVTLWAAILLFWSLAIKVATWKAANAYRGPSGWAVLAKVYVSADAPITVTVVIAALLPYW